MKVAHLPVYDDNPYQPRLLAALQRQGIEIERGGGGGNFFRSALFRWKADILHFHWLHPYLLRHGWLSSVLRSARFLIEVGLLRLAGKRIVWTVHNLQNHQRRHTGVERWFTCFFTRLAHRVIAHSPTGKDQAASAFGITDRDRIAVVYHGSYVGCYPNEVSADEARTQLGLATTTMVFLFLGRVQPYKGVLELIDTFRKLQLPDAKLVIAGKTADAATQALVDTAIAGDPAIEFHAGYVADERLQLFMNAADVVVFPFRDILTSGSVILAMSFGRACIAPAIGSIPDTLPREGGFLYDPDSQNGLATALSRAHTDRANLAVMGRHNFELVRNRTWDDVAADTATVYAQAQS